MLQRRESTPPVFRALAGVATSHAFVIARSRKPRSGVLSRLRQTDFANQFGVAGVGAETIHLKCGVQFSQQEIMLAVPRVQPLEGLLLIAQVGVETGDQVRGHITNLALSQPDLDAFNERAAPTGG